MHRADRRIHTFHPTQPLVGKEGTYFRGKARVFDCEEAMLEALSTDQASFKGTVIVIRWGEGEGVWGKWFCIPLSIWYAAGPLSKEGVQAAVVGFWYTSPRCNVCAPPSPPLAGTRAPRAAPACPRC